MQTDSSAEHQPQSPLGDSLFASRMHEIEKTNQMLNQLENKLTGFFNGRRGSEKKESPGTQRHDFKLINPRGVTGERRSKRNLQDLMNRKTELSSAKARQPATDRHHQNLNPNTGPQSESKGGFRSQQINQLNRMEQYYKRKNALIETKILQLQQQLDLDEQQKLSLFQQNQRLEREFKEQQQALPTEPLLEEEHGQQGLVIIELEKQLQARKDVNRRLHRQVSVLKQNYKTLKRTKTQYMQEQLQAADDTAMKQIQHLKDQLAKEKLNHQQLREQFAKNQQIQRLKQQLGRLKRLVVLKAGRSR